MSQRPNVLFLMSDQHNAGSMGCAGHPNVRTPNLDRLAESGVRFTRAYCNNPICSPSRISYVSGQYPHTHRVVGNNNFEFQDRNPATLGATLRRHGYQTAMIGKGHMIREWDEEAYEHLRYCDLCDADRRDPRKNHYFKYLIDNGIGDMYEDGSLPRDHEAISRKHAISGLPYEHTNEAYTGRESLEFLQGRDQRRPFFLHMSFERPHPHWMPAAEHADMYDPADIELGPDFMDWWENRWAGRPEFVSKMAANRMGMFETIDELKEALAYHFALVTVIDMEIGRVLDHLRETGELENTIVVYTADHGDFAGDHGIADKNMGIYESIHRVPWMISYPGCPQGQTRDAIIESCSRRWPNLRTSRRPTASMADRSSRRSRAPARVSRGRWLSGTSLVISGGSTPFGQIVTGWSTTPTNLVGRCMTTRLTRMRCAICGMTKRIAGRGWN